MSKSKKRLSETDSASTPVPRHEKSVLTQRILEGKADPISPRERENAADMLAFYEKKFGKKQA